MKFKLRILRPGQLAPEFTETGERALDPLNLVVGHLYSLLLESAKKISTFSCSSQTNTPSFPVNTSVLFGLVFLFWHPSKAPLYLGDILSPSFIIFLGFWFCSLFALLLTGDSNRLQMMLLPLHLPKLHPRILHICKQSIPTVSHNKRALVFSCLLVNCCWVLWQ